ncbi:MAG TPA: HEAT repeat domain-containing protein [Thermoanaerobaculia bacterium]|nr:HEAT repeat domain-containing protein [Thermoanaerobaculia bacterium]
MAGSLGAQDQDRLVREYAKKLAAERDPKERAHAAHWLGGRKNPEAISALAAALSDPDASVRQAAASALWDTGEAAAAAKPQLEKALGDRDAAVLARVAGALAAMGVPRAELADAWRRALSGAHDDATAFLAARGLIGAEPAEKLAPPILAYLARNAREAAHPKPGKSSLDDRDSADAAGKALERLLKTGAAPVVPQLEDTIRQTPESGRWVLGALAAVPAPPPGTLELALVGLESTDASTRSAALSLASKLTAEREAARWVPAGTRALGDADASVRLESCWALQRVKGIAHDAAPELARLVASDPDAGVRVRAAEALGEIGNASNPISKAARASVAAAAGPALEAAMKSQDHALAVAAVGAYNGLFLDTPAVVAALAEVAASAPDVPARQRALLCLRNRQGQAKSALPAIRPLVQSSDKVIADEARTAVEWIERGGAGSPDAIAAAGAAAAAPGAAAKREAAPAETSAPPASAGAVPSGSEERGMAALRARHLEFDETGFYRALSEADGEAIRAYLDAGMSPRLAFAFENQRSPLMVLFFHRQACGQGADGRDVVALLIERGADVNAVDDKKNTALMFAADNCDRGTIRLLLKAGARRDAKNWAGLTALQMGIVSGNPGLEELIAAGARLDAATAKTYAESYKNNPKALALIKKATAP